jgi:hypothetical protein
MEGKKMVLFVTQYDKAMNEAAKAVRAEMIRLDYVESDVEYDGEDKAISVAAVTTYLRALLREIPDPSEFAATVQKSET